MMCRYVKSVAGLLFLCMLLGTTGCMKKYNAYPLRHLSVQEADYFCSKKQVDVAAKKLNKNDMRVLFDGWDVCGDKRPVQITIVNKSPFVWLLSPAGIAAPLVSTDSIPGLYYGTSKADLLKTVVELWIPLTLMMGLVGVGVPEIARGFGFHPVETLLQAGSWMLMVIPIAAAIAFPIGICCNIIRRSLCTRYLKEGAYADFKSKLLSAPLLIKPSDTISTLMIFKESQDHFRLTLTHDSDALNFDVNLGLSS